MSDINKEIRSQALNAEARRADREKHFDLVFKAHQNKTENFVDEQLVIDPDWVHSSKVLFEWNEGRPFEGDDRSAAEYGYNELARFNNKYFNSSEPWSETDSRELLDHMMRLKNAGDHQKVAFSYLHEVFDQKDPAVSGFHNISKQVAASPSDILTSASLVDRYSGRQSAKNSAKYVSRRLARDVMATRMGEFLPQDEILFDESDAALLDDIETLYPTGGERQLSGNWREDLGFLGSAASVALGLAKGIYEGVPAGIQGILDLGTDLDSKMPLGKVVWGRGNGIEWVSPDDPNYQNAPSITIAGADAFAADEVDPDIPNGEIIAKELAKGLTQFITVFTLGGGLAGQMARGMAAGALADATFDPQAGNLSTVLKEFGVENELVNFLDSQVGEDATPEERLVARTKQAFEGLGLSALIEPFIIAVKRAKDMGAGPAVKSMLQDAGDAWISLVPAPGQLNMGIGTTGGAEGVVKGAKEFFGVSSAFTPEPGAVSTRFPTAVKKEEDPFAQNLVIGLDEFKKQPDLFKHNVQMTREYPNIQKSGTRSVETKSEEFIEHAKSNLLYLHDSVPPAIRDRSKLWYDGANRITKQLASEYKISEDSAAGVMAALSPQKDWFMNASLGQRLIDIAQNHSDIVFDGELYDHAIKIYTQKESTSASQKAKHLKVLNSIKGESFSELSAGKRAYVVRAYDELYNSRDYAIVAPEGEFLGPKLSDSGAPSKVAWGSNSEIGNALKALMADGDINQISEALGAYHKVRNFYNNIRLPNSPNGYVTVDTHAVAAALLRPLAGHDKEVKHMLGSGMKGERGPKNSAVIGIKGLYALYAEAYRRAASERGLLPREMQSITWEAVRGLYPDTFKSGKTNKAEIDKIWKLYKNKKMTLDEARQAAVEYAGGINLPDWAQ